MVRRTAMASLAGVTFLWAGASSAQPGDPLKAFQPILERCRAEVAALPMDRISESKDRGWAHSAELHPPKVSYDVKRTDSLVSPYTAVIRLERTVSVVYRPTEEEARAAKPEGRANLSIREFHFAYQSGRWSTTGGSSQMKTREAADREFVDEFRMGVVQSSRENMLALKQLTGCVQP